MAICRMFNRGICHSGRNLKMPKLSRLLYQDLLLEADDDGVVEAYTVLRMTNADEADLKYLFDEGWVVPLNNDLVCYIPDWLQHNKIRADRKRNSLHLNLLLRVLPDVEILEPKQRADRRVDRDKKEDEIMGRPMDGVGQDRLGQDRLGQQQLLIGCQPESVAVVDEMRKSDVVDVRKEFERRGLPITIAKNFLKIFSKEMILKQLSNLDSQKQKINSPLGWLYKACQNDYSYSQLESQKEKEASKRKTVDIGNTVIEPLAKESEKLLKEKESESEIVIKNSAIAEKAAQLLKELNINKQIKT